MKIANINNLIIFNAHTICIYDGYPSKNRAYIHVKHLGVFHAHSETELLPRIETPLQKCMGVAYIKSHCFKTCRKKNNTTLLIFSHNMDQPTETTPKEVKPRKRFVGRARRNNPSPSEEGGAIEDGAVGFASNIFLIISIKLCLLIQTSRKW
jgi:hypothetical protein